MTLSGYGSESDSEYLHHPSAVKKLKTSPDQRIEAKAYANGLGPCQ